MGFSFHLFQGGGKTMFVVLLAAFASFFCDLTPQLGCWTAARVMHIIMLCSILRAPLTFFDTTPTGRIIGRFAKDVDVVDTTLPQQISDSIYCLFEVMLTLCCIHSKISVL
jgi:ATP-binding cassette subfamily C (CFTR/MRP) protein 1